MTDLNCCEKLFGNTLGVGCCIGENSFKKESLAEVTQNEDRRCTDLPCLLVLILVILSEIYLVFHASNNGADPQ